jgi:hypothetical protein
MISLIFASLRISHAHPRSNDFRKTGVSAAKTLKILEMPPKVDQREGRTTDDVHGKIEELGNTVALIQRCIAKI